MNWGLKSIRLGWDTTEGTLHIGIVNKELECTTGCLYLDTEGGKGRTEGGTEENIICLPCFCKVGDSQDKVWSPHAWCAHTHRRDRG